MRPSLRSRLLGLSIGVAALAVSATALLADSPRAGHDTAGPLLETDGEIRAALATYANEHRDWAGVDTLVEELARRTGRRVALVTPSGQPIADSAVLLGSEPTELPPSPSARIDATALPSPEITLRPTIVVRAPEVKADYSLYVWQLTEQERRQRQALADQAVECLRGKENPVRQASSRRRLHEVGDGDLGTPPDLPCMPPAVHAPSAAGRELHRRTVELTAACLDEHRLAYEVTAEPAVRPTPATARSPLWTECAQTARVAAKRSYVAEPADLYLGENPDPGSRWTVLAVAAILLAALAVLVGRRLVRPLPALTAAAGRVAEGDRTARVSARGNDELTRLVDAFNAMAAAVEATDRQRQELVGDVAHELRTPLTTVRSHLEAVRDGVLPLDAGLVRSLMEESTLLEHLVDDLRDLALADAGMLRVHPEERDATELAEAVVSAHRVNAEESEVDLVLRAPAPVTVHADPARLRQALGNLVANAVRHTPPGGRVVVSVREVAGEAVLTVADTGPGIAPEHLPRIFDRFFSRAAGGTGLGLAIARHLATAHGGRVEVTSAPGEGAVFALRLPGFRQPEADGNVTNAR